MKIKKWFTVNKILIYISALTVVFAVVFEYFKNRDLYRDEREAVMIVRFVDVGQGDCIVIQSGNMAMMVDSGKSSEKQNIRSFLLSHGIKRLDYILLTHPHSDHIGSLQYILRNFECDELIMPFIDYDDKDYRRLLEYVDENNIHLTEAVPGTDRSFAGSSFTVLAPLGYGYEEMNDCSAVIKLSCCGVDILLAGDIEAAAEADIVSEYGEILDCDILKVPHHGSDTSSTRIFLSAVSPSYCVISAGDNNYNHPNENIVRRLKEYTENVYVTKENGTVSFYIFESGEYKVRTEK